MSHEGPRTLETKKIVEVDAVQVLMVRQGESGEIEVFLGRRKSGAFPEQLSTPGGKIDEGETPEEAAVRELQEETGLHIDTREKLKLFSTATSETTREKDGVTKVYRYKFNVYLFDASGLSPVNASPGEYYEVMWVPVSKAIEMHRAALAAVPGGAIDKIPGALTPRVAESVNILSTFKSVREVELFLRAPSNEQA